MADYGLSRSLSDLSSSLSSASSLSDSQQLDFDCQSTEAKIDAYVPLSQKDMTKRIFRSFFHHLPFDGRRVFCRYIAKSCGQDALTSLANHLNAAILVPSRSVIKHLRHIAQRPSSYYIHSIANISIPSEGMRRKDPADFSVAVWRT